MADKAHEQHILPIRLYLKIGLALLLLTALTVWVAQYHLGEWNLIVAMAVAATKGTLVALFFMHLKYTNRIYTVVFVGALLMLAVFIVLTMFDTMSRDSIYELKAHPIDNRAVIYEHDTAAVAPSDSAAAISADTVGTPGH